MLQKPDKIAPALYGGIIMGVLYSVPFLNFVNCLCCAGILFGGFMSVYFYWKQMTAEMGPMTSGDTVALGALAGVFGAIVSMILGILFFLLLGDAMSKMFLEFMENAGIFKNMPPEARMEMERSITRPGIGQWLFSIFSYFITCPLFGLLGGLIGYAAFRNRGNKGEAPQE